jgi:SAM-dependent methyltransferase
MTKERTPVGEIAVTTDSLPVHPANADAYRAWDGDDGAYWTEHERIFDGSLSRYMPQFLEAAAITPTDHVLDVGCGTGQTTRAAARSAPSGSALGVDLSSAMIERARRRAEQEGLTNASFLQADAQIHPFDAERFDLVVSRTGTMFFGDPFAAFTNLGSALRPAGRMVLLVWQLPARNHWFRDFASALAGGRELPTPPPDAPGPFSLADPERIRTILAAAGFTEVTIDGVEQLMWFGDDPDEADRFVRGLGFTEFMLRGLDEAGRARALDDLRSTIDAHSTTDGVLYPSATWLVTAERPGAA